MKKAKYFLVIILSVVVLLSSCNFVNAADYSFENYKDGDFQSRYDIEEINEIAKKVGFSYIDVSLEFLKQMNEKKTYIDGDSEGIIDKETGEEFYEMINKKCQEQVKDSSLTVKAAFSLDKTDGSDYDLKYNAIEINPQGCVTPDVFYLYFLKNGVPYAKRTVGYVLTIPTVNLQGTIKEEEIQDNVINEIKTKYSQEIGNSITKVWKTKKGDLDFWGEEPEEEEKWITVSAFASSYPVEDQNLYWVEYEYENVVDGKTVKSKSVFAVFVRKGDVIKLQDETTDIKLEADENVISKDTKISAEKITEEETYNTVKKAITQTSDKFVVYNIDLLKDSKKIQPNGKVKITLQVPSNMDTSKLTVYRIEENGESIEYTVTVESEEENKVVSFETDHFSTYVLAEKNVINKSENDKEQEKTSTDNIDNIQKSDETKAPGEIPQAGIKYEIKIFLAVLSLLAIGIFIKYNKMKDIK